MKVVFNFGGFYNSFYSDAIDDVIYEDDVENTIDADAVDYNNLHIEVSKRIVEQFNEFLSNEYDLEVDLKFLSLDSPRYYNYSTDKIIVEISKDDLTKLDLLVANDSDVSDTLKDFVKDVTTSKSGYIPFFDYDKVIAKIDSENESVYYQTLLDVLIALNKDYYDSVTLECLNETISCSI